MTVWVSHWIVDSWDHTLLVPQLRHCSDGRGRGQPPAQPRDQRDEGAALPPPGGAQPPAAPGGLSHREHLQPPARRDSRHQGGGRGRRTCAGALCGGGQQVRGGGPRLLSQLLLWPRHCLAARQDGEAVGQAEQQLHVPVESVGNGKELEAARWSSSPFSYLSINISCVFNPVHLLQPLITLSVMY